MTFDGVSASPHRVRVCKYDTGLWHMICYCPFVKRHGDRKGPTVVLVGSWETAMRQAETHLRDFHRDSR